MAATASPCVRSVTIPRYTTDRDWYINDMDVRGNKLAVFGYKDRTHTSSFIDLFTLNDPDSSSPLMTQLFTKLLDRPRGRYRRGSFLDDTRIVTVCYDLVQVYRIEAVDSEPLHTVSLLQDRSAECVTVREGEIFIGLQSVNEVIVFDFSFNEIKTITLEGLGTWYFPTEITVYGDNLFISADPWRAIRYNMEGKIVHEYKTPGYSHAYSITVSGLVYILWGWLHVVVYSLSDNQQLMSLNVDVSHIIRIVDVNRLLTVNIATGEVREYSMTQLCTFENLKRTLCRVMSPIDCAELKRFFKITDLDMSTNGNESRDTEAGTRDDRAAHLLAVLEMKGFIGSDNLDGLKNAFQHLGTSHVSMLRSQLESFQLHSKPSEEDSDSQSTPVQDSHIWGSLSRFSTRGKWKVDDLAVEVSGKIIVSGHGIQDGRIFLDTISPKTVRGEDTGLLTIELSYEGNADNKNCDDDDDISDEDSSDNSSVYSMSDYLDRNHITSIIDENRIVSCQGKTLKILNLMSNTEVPSITLDGIASCVEVRGSDILVGYKSNSPDPLFPCIDVFDSALRKKRSIKLKDLHRRASVIDLSLFAGKLLVLTGIGILESEVCLFDGDGNRLLNYSPPLCKKWVARSVAVNDTYQMVAILWSVRWNEYGTYLSFHLVDSGLCLCLAEVNLAYKLRFMTREELILVSSKGQISSYKKTYFFSYNNLIVPIMESLDSEVSWNILWQFFAVSADERTNFIEDEDEDDQCYYYFDDDNDDDDDKKELKYLEKKQEKLVKRFMAFLDEKLASSSQRFAALWKATTELERYHAFALSTCIDYYECVSSGTGSYNDQPYQLLHYYESSVPLGETAATQRQIQSVDDVPGTSNSSPPVSVPSQSEIRRTGPSTYYPASTNNSAPKRRAPPYSGTNVGPHNKRKLNYPSLKGTLTGLLSKKDCHQLARHVALPTDQLDAIINSKSSSKDLLDILEERGVIHPSNVSRLLEAISVLKINETAMFMLERYQRSRGDETSYGRFLAGLSSHLLLSLPRKLCDYFEFTSEKKKAVITSQTPGISFLLTLEDMGVINPFDVGKLVTPLKQYQLVQAVAKVQEYQTLVDERSELKKPIHSLEGKQTLFMECLRKKTKSWYETMTPLPWKKSCKWMTSELFIACDLVLTVSKSKMKTTDVDQECKLKYTDILTHRRLKSATRIIIEGDPGSGKTMLSSQLAYDWCIGKSSDARMVVFLPLKFVDGMTIIEAIKQFYIPKGKPLNEGDIKAILDQASDENKTCIVLDGLEEYNGRTKDGEPSEVERVMRKEKFPNCTVVLTSRSDFVHDLPQCPMLKLGRFGEEERDQYIANIIPDDREKQQKVKCSIETSALLYDLCSNPLLFVYIVHNIEHLGQIDKPKGQLDSVGPFIEVMVNTLLSLSRSEHSESSESEIMSKRLSEIAFNGLCKGYQQLMWQKSFLNENVSNVKDWIESGILVVEEGVMAREEEHRNKEEAVEEGMVTQDKIKVIKDERREGESSSEAAMIGEGQDDILSIDEESPSDRGSSTDNKLNEKEKPFTEMKTSTDPQNLSVRVKSLHQVIQERFADNDRRQGESSSEAAMIGKGQDNISSIDEENPSDRGSSTDNKTKETEKPFTERKTTTDLQNLSLQVKFLHKVIQEWFAAKHFSSMLQRSKGKNRHQYFLNRHLPLINPADLHYVLRFTSYLCPENCYLIMEHLHSCYKSSKGVVPEYILNCIFLCFIECNSSVRNKEMENPVRQVCENIVTIRGGDSRILQQSKVSMLMYASNSKIRIGTLRLVDLVVEVTKAMLTFNSNITLECFPTLKVIEVSRWDMRLKEEDFEELIKFITKCKLLNKAFLSFPSPPPLLIDKKVLSSMKKDLTIEWIIGDRIVHTLDKKSGEWPMQFRSTPHQITDFSQPGPSKSSAHSGKKKKAKERTATSKSGQKQDTEEPGSITTKKKHVNTGSQKIVQTPQITKVRDPTSVKQSSTSARQETERVGKSTAGIADLVVTTATIQPPDVLTQLHESLQNVFAEMTRSDSENLANFFMFPLKHVKAIVNSPSHSKDLVVELENKGIIQSALTDELLENLGALNILTGRSEGSKSSIYRPSSTFLKHEEDWKPPDSMKIKSSISEKGGLLQIPNTGIKLVFPPNAVTEERNIQVKIIPPSLLNEPATSFSSNSSVVLELLPNGLQLKREVSLTLPHCLTFANEEKAKAKVYVSHHEEGQRPRWEERPLSPYIFHRSKCTVRLTGFCWLKIVIDDKEVVAKNIVVYAAKKILQNMETVRVSYGYYEEIPDREPKILNLNPDLKLVQSLLFTIFKEGKQPITISFNGTYPRNSWAIEQGNEKQEMPWGYIDLSKEFLVHFELQRRQSRDSFCKFTAQQGNSDPIKFSIAMERYLSRDEIADRSVPDYILEYLAEKLCSEWQSLARYLNISDGDLDNVKEDNRRCHQDTKYFMLVKWRKRNGTGATCRVLATALDKAGRKDLQQYVERQVADLRDQRIQIKHKYEDREKSSSKYHLQQKDLEDREKKRVRRKRKRAKHRHHEVKRKSTSPQRKRAKHKHHKEKRKSTSPQMERAKHKHHKEKRKSVSPQRKRAKQY